MQDMNCVVAFGLVSAGCVAGLVWATTCQIQRMNCLVASVGLVFAVCVCVCWPGASCQTSSNLFRAREGCARRCESSELHELFCQPVESVADRGGGRVGAGNAWVPCMLRVDLAGGARWV